MVKPSEQRFDAVHVACGEIFAIARDACEKKLARRSGDPLVAIVFAHGAIEAFANEIFWLAEQAAAADQRLSILASMGRELVEPTSLMLKVNLIRAVLGGPPYDKSSRPYQDFKFLVQLRNEIVHLKLSMTYKGDAFTEEVEVSYSDRIKKIEGGLRALCLWEEPQSTQFPTIIHWLGRLRSPATEMWACVTALAVTNSIRLLVKHPAARASLDGICDVLLRLPENPA